jgi:hypothetical protein
MRLLLAIVLFDSRGLFVSLNLPRTGQGRLGQRRSESGQSSVYAESTATMITHDDHTDDVMVCASHAPTRGLYLPCAFYCLPDTVDPRDAKGAR